MKYRAAVCVLVFVAALAAQTTGAFGLDLRPKIDPLARALIEDGVAVGFVVGIVKDGETQVIAYGETIRGSGVTPDGDTVYEIGSMSKAFTGVLLADMVNRGRMALDDPVQNYLPEGVTIMTRPGADARPITIEHLVTHTSGLPRMPGNFKPADMTNPYVDYTVSQMFEFLNGHKLRRPPGKYEYSNYGMGLLGQLIARQADKSYEQCLIDVICDPLGMNDTRITLTEDQAGRFASPYNASLELDHAWDLPALAGAGAIRSTCNDMLKFIGANLAEDVDKPITKALRLSHRKRHTMDDGQGIGLAWHIAQDRITRWHNGMTGGYHSWIGVIPRLKIGVVVLANTATPQVTEFGQNVTRIAFGMNVAPPKSPDVVQVSAAVLESYAGVYQMTPQFALTVTVEGGKLMIQATGQAKFQVFAESETEFFYKVVDAQISFVRDKNGRADHLILHQGGMDQKAVRKD